MGTLLAPVLAMVVLGVAAVVLSLQRASQRRLIGGGPRASWPGGGAVPDIVYFTGPNCTVCHVAQRPALRRLRDLMGDVTIHEVDVAVEPQTARSYRVMTLPTTVVLDREGRTTAINTGFATETVLRDQVTTARLVAEAPAVA